MSRVAPAPEGASPSSPAAKASSPPGSSRPPLANISRSHSEKGGGKISESRRRLLDEDAAAASSGSSPMTSASNPSEDASGRAAPVLRKSRSANKLLKGVSMSKVTGLTDDADDANFADDAPLDESLSVGGESAGNGSRSSTRSQSQTPVAEGRASASSRRGPEQRSALSPQPRADSKLGPSPPSTRASRPPTPTAARTPRASRPTTPTRTPRASRPPTPTRTPRASRRPSAADDGAERSRGGPTSNAASDHWRETQAGVQRSQGSRSSGAGAGSTPRAATPLEAAAAAVDAARQEREQEERRRPRHSPRGLWREGITAVIAANRFAHAGEENRERRRAKAAEERRRAILRERAPAHEAYLARELDGSYENPAQILPYLYIGGQGDAEDLELLLHIGVTHVLNAAASIDATHADRFVYLHCELDDEDDEDVASAFASAFRHIEDARAGGGAVLVHCVAGMSRSVALTTAWLIRGEGMTLFNALNLIRQRRPVALPNKGFRLTLARFEVAECGASSVKDLAADPAWNFPEWNKEGKRYRSRPRNDRSKRRPSDVSRTGDGIDDDKGGCCEIS